MSRVSDDFKRTQPEEIARMERTPDTDESNIVDTPKDEASSRHRSMSDFLVFSNVIYIIIGAVYATKGRPAVATLVTLSGLTSFVYHFSRETAAGEHTITNPRATSTSVAHQVIASSRAPSRGLRAFTPFTPHRLRGPGAHVCHLPDLRRAAPKRFNPCHRCRGHYRYYRVHMQIFDSGRAVVS